MPKLTDRLLISLQVPEGRKDRLLFDSQCPGLAVRVTTKGTRTFLVQWTDKLTRRKVREPLGVWGSITIEQARSAARARLGEVAKGLDPVADRNRKRAAAEREKAELALTLDALLARWADLHLSSRRPRYADEAVRSVRFAFARQLGEPAARLSRAQTVAVLDEIVAKGNPVTAGRTMAYARACYSWAEKRGMVPLNPFRNLPVSAATTERERVLSDEELRDIWAAAVATPYPFGPFYQIAILTLQRRDEVAGMRWSELSPDGCTWLIPGARMKNGKPHDVHLSPPARQILRQLPRRDGHDLVFSTTGRTPISGFSRAKQALDATVVMMRRGNGRPSKTSPALVPWRLHDIRRTGVSTLARLGVDSVVADKLLGHQAAKLRGVAAVYQRHDFAEERARALETWASHVIEIVGENAQAC
jgi:integrase